MLVRVPYSMYWYPGTGMYPYPQCGCKVHSDAIVREMGQSRILLGLQTPRLKGPTYPAVSLVSFDLAHVMSIQPRSYRTCVILFVLLGGPFVGYIHYSYRRSEICTEEPDWVVIASFLL